jgi:probable HAF family extracellular repeat protein
MWVIQVKSNMSNGQSEAFLYDGGVLQDLGPGSANGINDPGQIVVGVNGPFLYNDGAKYGLNIMIAGSGWNLSNATGINDSGQIVGWGWNPAGETHAFLLNPVPEPSRMALIASGAALTVCVVRRQRRKVMADAWD